MLPQLLCVLLLFTPAFSQYFSPNFQCNSPLYHYSQNCSENGCLCGEDIHVLSNEIKYSIANIKPYMADQVMRMQSRIESDLQRLLRDVLNPVSPCKQFQQVGLYQVGTTESPVPVMENCKAIYQSGRTVGGVFKIQPRTAPLPFDVLCDMDSKLGGWEVVLKRYDGKESFRRSWEEYRNGFGDLKGEFWMGLEKLYQITNAYECELFFLVVDGKNDVHEHYFSKFRISGESSGYKIEVLETPWGAAQGRLVNQIGAMFSTQDHDNDFSPMHCAQVYGAGWWFNNCADWIPTGTYFNPGTSLYNPYNQQAWVWMNSKGDKFNPARVRMMVRPAERMMFRK